jgi:hypothetical protein
MPNNLGHDLLAWSADIWSSIEKAVADEHKLTAIAAQFLTPPVPDSTMNGTVAADTVLTGDDGVLSVDESENRSIVEIAVQFKVRQAQVENEAQMKTAESLATRAANLLAKGEDLLIFQGLAALTDPLFKSKSVLLRLPKNTKNPSSPVDSFLFKNPQTIQVEPAEVNPSPALNVYGENTYAAVAEGYAKLQENHYGRQALVLPTTIYADTYAARATTLEIPAIVADRIKGLIGNYVYGTSTLPIFDAKNKKILKECCWLGQNTWISSFKWVEAKDTSGDYVFNVHERGVEIEGRNAVFELDFAGENDSQAK